MTKSEEETKSFLMKVKEESEKADFKLNMGFPDSSVGKEFPCNEGDPDSITGWGGFAGEGISPFNTIRFIFTSGFGLGIAEKSAWVYGCKGFEKISFFDPNSTIEPRYITPILSEINFTTERS